MSISATEISDLIKKKIKELDLDTEERTEGTVVGLADGILSADGKIIYKAENLKVGLFKSWKE